MGPNGHAGASGWSWPLRGPSECDMPMSVGHSTAIPLASSEVSTADSAPGSHADAHPA